MSMGANEPEDDTLIDVYVGTTSLGQERFERLWVRGRPDGSFRLVRTPKMALGVAVDDVFTVDGERVIDTVVSRGENWAVQATAMDGLHRALLDRLIAVASRHGGTLDVHDHRTAGLRIPHTASWELLSSDMESMVSDKSLVAWWIGNTAPLVRKSG